MNRVIVAAVIAITLSAALSAQAQNTVTFDNQSGEPALVKLIGPTSKEVEVPIGTKESVGTSAGRYIIKVRYGTAGKYRYSKGEEFDVKETASTRSSITITLHKVVAGNYESAPISREQFEGGAVSRNSTVRPDTPPASTRTQQQDEFLQGVRNNAQMKAGVDRLNSRTDSSLPPYIAVNKGLALGLTKAEIEAAYTNAYSEYREQLKARHGR